MKVSKNVKLLVLFSVLTVHSVAALYPRLECGKYEGIGTLKVNSNHDYLLVLHDRTSERFELVLLGGKVEEKESFIQRKVKAIFRVIRPTDYAKNTQVVMDSIASAKEERIENRIRLINKEPCSKTN